MTITIVGIGLIGGSMAINLKESGFADHIIGVDKSVENIDKALRRRLIDEGRDDSMTLEESLRDAVAKSDVIVMSIPVNALLEVLPQVLDQVDRQVVLDVGSTKVRLLEKIKTHPKRAQFVATHPMAGTEFSGPEAALPNLFQGKVTVLCDVEDSAMEAKIKVEELYRALRMNILYMNADDHDVHTAYVSHISHISSFALALTVLEKEKNEDRIFALASGGFSSTVRLAKSSPEMWVPIFEQNRDNVMDVLDEHINSLAKFRSLLIKKDYKKIHELIQQSNEIKRILK
ncbi:MAG: prephenate dehydrogenase [Bacteroidota bacterium]